VVRKPTLRWLPSQKGLFADAPHLHSATRVSFLTGVWSWAKIWISPCRYSGPLGRSTSGPLRHWLLRTLIRAAKVQRSCRAALYNVPDVGRSCVVDDDPGAATVIEHCGQAPQALGGMNAEDRFPGNLDPVVCVDALNRGRIARLVPEFYRCVVLSSPAGSPFGSVIFWPPIGAARRQWPFSILTRQSSWAPSASARTPQVWQARRMPETLLILVRLHANDRIVTGTDTSAAY
jgi:hypothetical protein